jgi:uncharacterized protein (TIGR00255 family)
MRTGVPERPLQIEHADLSLLGHREENQDRVAIAIGDDAVFLAVVDGMGGHADGARAAEVNRIAGGTAGSIDPLDVLRWPGVIRETERDISPLAAEATALLRETAADLNAARAREGARIREMLAQRCEALREIVATLRAKLPELSARIRARVAERVAQLGTQVDPERLEQEIVLLAYKMDVEEELDRVGSHLTETLQVLDSKEPAGRRLDFLMQEFNREANTLSSKSQDVEMTRAAVDMKVLIEQMREQVQNVE